MLKLLLYTLILIMMPVPFGTRNKGDFSIYSQENSKIIKQKPLRKKQISDEGKNLYLKNCMSCHQSDGSGVPGMYPPLQKSNWVNSDKTILIKIMLNGLQGEIKVNGETYIQSMPSHKYLTDSQIAEVLSFVRKNFGNNADSVSAEEVTALRRQKSK